MRSHGLVCGLAILVASFGTQVAIPRTARGNEPLSRPPASSWIMADPTLFGNERIEPNASQPSPLHSISFVEHSVGGGIVEFPELGDYSVQKESVCCPPFWTHRTGVFGEYLLLRPRDAYVPYAVPIDGPIVPPPVNPIQVGPVAVVDPDFSSGFRAGATWAMDECTSLVGTYTFFENHTQNAVSIGPPNVLRSLVTHPGTLNAGDDYLSAEADLNVRFQTADFDYRTIWWLSDWSVINWFVGARYAKLDQDFDSRFGETGTDDFVNSTIDFEGVGLRLGLDGERHNCHGFLLYGRGALSLLGGEYRSDYSYRSNADPQIVNTTFKAGRLLPIGELELGAGWQSPCGHFRLTAGYVINMWFSALTTDSWIRSVHENRFIGQSDAISYDTLTFDGLTARAEYRF